MTGGGVSFLLFKMIIESSEWMTPCFYSYRLSRSWWQLSELHRLPSPLPPALPGWQQGIPKPAERCNLCSTSWFCPRASPAVPGDSPRVAKQLAEAVVDRLKHDLWMIISRGSGDELMWSPIKNHKLIAGCMHAECWLVEGSKYEVWLQWRVSTLSITERCSLAFNVILMF